MNAIALVELASFPLRLLAEVPRPTTLIVQVHALDAAHGEPSSSAWPSSSPLHLTTSRAIAARAAELHLVALSPLEYEALALGLEDGRLTPRSARALLQRRRGAGERITAAVELAMAGVVHSEAGQHVVVPGGGGGQRWRYTGRWTFGELVAALGGELVGVEVEDQREAAAVVKSADSEAA